MFHDDVRYTHTLGLTPLELLFGACVGGRLVATQTRSVSGIDVFTGSRLLPAAPFTHAQLRSHGAAARELTGPLYAHHHS